MKKLISLTLFIILIFSGCTDKSGLPIRVISFNIRYDNPADGLNAWPNRKEIAASFLKNEKPDIFGLQEALWHQYAYIDSVLRDYESIAAGRDDGMQKGEMTPVFYRKDIFRALESGTFWLSETPDVAGSRGWGAVLPRIVTWVKLEEEETGRRFFFFNTHYSHMSDSARIMSSIVLQKELVKIAGENPFVISGDFNMVAGSEAYTSLCGSLIRDSFLLSETEASGPDYTFNGFRDEIEKRRIDYIFVREGIQVLEHSTINLREGDIFISDHWPVKASLIMLF